MLNIPETYNHTLQLLKENPFAELVSAELHPPAGTEILSRIAELIGQPVPRELLDLYEQANGFTIEWKATDDSGLYGYFDIWSIERMFTGTFANLDIDSDSLRNVFEETLIIDLHEDEQRTTRQKHRMLESHWGQPAYTTITIENDRMKLWYLDDDQIIPLPLSLEEYIRLLFESMGLDSVRHYLQFPEFFKTPYTTEPRLKKVQQLFPSTDLLRIPAFQ